MHLRRSALVVVTLALAAVSTACPPPDPPTMPPTTAPAPMACVGIVGDNASSLGDSKSTVGLLSTVAGGPGVLFQFPGATITATVPTAVRATDGPYPVAFELRWGTLAATNQTLSIFRTLLGIASLTIEQSGFSVSTSGAATTTVTSPDGNSTSADTAVGLTLAPSRVSFHIGATGTGAVTYGPFRVRLTVPVNSSIAGVVLNTLRLDCTATAVLPTTTVS